MSEMLLQGKVALITGGSSGIGRATALCFAAAGATVVVNYRQSAEKARAIVDTIHSRGGSALDWQADVSHAHEVDTLVEAVLQRVGHIDILACIAGADILTGAGAETPDAVKLERLLEVDLKGTMNCCWALAPLMRAAGGGSIVTMSWDLAVHGMVGRNPQMFAAAKAGVLGFSKSLALSYAPEVRVNILAPGWIETDFIRDVMAQEARAAVLKQTPLGRFGTPADVAEAALFLVSSRASFITGQTLYINGGLAT